MVRFSVRGITTYIFSFFVACGTVLRMLTAGTSVSVSLSCHVISCCLFLFLLYLFIFFAAAVAEATATATAKPLNELGTHKRPPKHSETETEG